MSQENVEAVRPAFGAFDVRGSAGTLALAEHARARPQRACDALGDGVPGQADLLAQEGGLAVGDIAVGEADPDHAPVSPRPRRIAETDAPPEATLRLLDLPNTISPRRSGRPSSG
jgi:hypothetical protein